MREITECEGYKKLLAAVESDEESSTKCHDYRGKLNWVIERAKSYAEKTGLDACDILNQWEKKRSYWYMNYYQGCNQPELNRERVRVFDSQDEFILSIGNGKDGFRCPTCGGVSKSPYRCTSGKKMSKDKICDWNVGGLFHDLGKGVFVFLKDKMDGETIFMPLAWENQ